MLFSLSRSFEKTNPQEVSTNFFYYISFNFFLFYFLVWFLFGIFGGHYYYKSKRFAQTRSHRLFLFFYLISFGGFGLLWIYDGFRVGNWVGGYTVGFSFVLLIYTSTLITCFYKIKWLTFSFSFFP